MWAFQSAVTRAFDLILKPFEFFPPLVGLLVVSAVTGVVMLLIFGFTSDQARITTAKDRLKAHIMEMWIFRNDPRAMFLAIGGVARYNLQYLRHSLRPIVFIFVPVILIMVQLGIRYASDPVPVGETARVRVELREGVRATETPVTLESPFGVRVVSPPLRVDAKGQIAWKIRAEIPGPHTLSFGTPTGPLTKAIVVAPDPRVGKVTAISARAGTWDAFLYPADAPIPTDSVVERIVIDYPACDLSVFGVNLHWLVIFFVVSVVVGYALKGVFGIEV